MINHELTPVHILGNRSRIREELLLQMNDINNHKGSSHKIYQNEHILEPFIFENCIFTNFCTCIFVKIDYTQYAQNKLTISMTNWNNLKFRVIPCTRYKHSSGI